MGAERAEGGRRAEGVQSMGREGVRIRKGRGNAEGAESPRLPPSTGYHASHPLYESTVNQIARSEARVYSVPLPTRERDLVLTRPRCEPSRQCYLFFFRPKPSTAFAAMAIRCWLKILE